MNDLPQNKFWRCRRIKTIYRIRIADEGKMGGKDVMLTRMDTGAFSLVSRRELAAMNLTNSRGDMIDIRMISKNRDMYACSQNNPEELRCMRVGADRKAEVNGHIVSNTIVLQEGNEFYTISIPHFKKMFRLVPEEHQLVEPHGARKAMVNTETKKRVPVHIDDEAMNNAEGSAKQESAGLTQCKAVAVVRNPETGRVSQYCLKLGNQFKLVTPQQTLTLAKDGRVENLKAVERNGSLFLSGVGISIKELPDYEKQ